MKRRHTQRQGGRPCEDGGRSRPPAHKGLGLQSRPSDCDPVPHPLQQGDGHQRPRRQADRRRGGISEETPFSSGFIDRPSIHVLLAHEATFL